MSTDQPASPIAEETPVAKATQTTPIDPNTIALDDWCQARSTTLGRRIEALSAFHKRCQRNGMGRATADEFEAAYQSFLAQPA